MNLPPLLLLIGDVIVGLGLATAGLAGALAAALLGGS